MGGDWLPLNLTALGRAPHTRGGPEAGLSVRLRLPVSNDHVRLAGPQSTGPVLYKRGLRWVPLSLSPEQVREALRIPDPPTQGPAPQVLLLGVGLGELVVECLARWPTARILAWDRDPWLLRLALERHDLAEPLKGGRLRLSLAWDLLDLLPWSGPVVVHPLLGEVYRDERILLPSKPSSKRALVVTGDLFVDDLSTALREEGYTVFPWEVRRHAVEEIRLGAGRIQPQVVACINYTQGLAEMCASLDLPLRCWEVDPALDPARVRGPVGDVRYYTYRKRDVPGLVGAGFKQAAYLPLATSPTLRRPQHLPPDSPYRVPVSFVGSSMVQPARDCQGRFVDMYRLRYMSHPDDAGKKLMERIVVEQRSHLSRYIVPDLLDSLCPGWRAEALERRGPDPAALLGEVASAEKRINVVARLAPFGVHVWGDDGWKICEGAGVRYRGPAGHGQELNQVYSGSTINVDINRLYQADIVTMRVFDILACGGFVLAEWGEALPELLEPGREVETWRTEEELHHKVRWYLDHPEAAREVARRGRERVLRDHTIRGRVGTLLQGA